MKNDFGWLRQNGCRSVGGDLFGFAGLMRAISRSHHTNLGARLITVAEFLISRRIHRQALFATGAATADAFGWNLLRLCQQLPDPEFGLMQLRFRVSCGTQGVPRPLDVCSR